MNRKIIFNSLWMMSEKIVSIFGLIFVTSFVAKYVGPDIFGNIALALSIFQLIQLASQLGSDVLIFKRLSRNKKSGINLINVTSRIRMIVYMALSVPVLIFNYFYMDSNSFFYVVAAFIACFIQAMDVYSIYYDATLNSKINTFVNIFGLIVSLLFRWYIAFMMLNPLWLCLPIVVAPLVSMSIRLFYFSRSTCSQVISKKFKKKYVKYMLGAGSSLVISSLSVAIYTRLSLLTLGAIDGKAAVGIYSVAASLATSWSFILNSLITSTLPSIFSELDENKAIKKTAKLNLIVVLVSVPVILGVFILGSFFINYFYGVAYLASYTPLNILTFSTMLGALGTVSARYIAKHAGYAFLSKKMLLVALFSLIVNIIFIYQYGIIGAAVANVLTQLLSLTLFNYFFKRGLILRLHMATLLFWRGRY